MLWHHCDHALVQFGHINLSVQVWKRKNMFWPKIPGLVATVAVYPSALLAADFQFHPQFYWAVLSQAAPAIDLLQSRTGPQCRLQLQPTSTRLPFKLILNSCQCWERDFSLVSLVLFVLSNIWCVSLLHCVHIQLFQEFPVMLLHNESI